MISLYLPFAVSSLILAIVVPAGSITPVLAWLGLSCLVVTIPYASGKPSRWRRSAHGGMRWTLMVLLIPVQAIVWCASLTDRLLHAGKRSLKPRHHLRLEYGLTPWKLYRLKQQGVVAVLDVTPEVPALQWSARLLGLDYQAAAIDTDGVADEAQLRRLLNWLEMRRQNNEQVLLHCSYRSRAPLFIAAAHLLALMPGRTARELSNPLGADAFGQLSQRQLAALETYRQSGVIQPLSRVWLIANPVAGGGKWHQHENEIIEQLERYFVLTVVVSTEQISARDLALKALADQADIVIACGGDGTLGEVAGVVADSNAILGMIPLGTSNSLCFALWGIDAKFLPVETACQQIIDGNIRKLDTATCNDELLLLAVGVGLEQQMISLADRDAKNDQGQIAYLQGLWQALQSGSAQRLEVSFDGSPFEKLETSSLVVANASPVSAALAQGGGRPCMDDGLLDVTWLGKEQQPVQQLNDLAGLMLAGITNQPANECARHRQVKQLVIRGQGEMDYVLDGEERQAREIDICIHPASLDVLSS